MAISYYRGFNLIPVGSHGTVWKVEIKKRTLQGSLNGVKKSIDWWCDTASIIEPSEFDNTQNGQSVAGANHSEMFNGYAIKNDTGGANDWYCMFNGKLLKGGKLAIQRHIEAYLVAKQQAQQQKK